MDIVSKHKGNIAQSAVILELQKHGFNVFTESGDLSRIDIIAEKENRLFKIQIKFSNDSKETAKLNIVKSGPNGYRYTYTNEDVDIFALYHHATETILWLTFNDINERENIVIRFDNNISTSNNYSEYSLEKLSKKLNLDILKLNIPIIESVLKNKKRKSKKINGLLCKICNTPLTGILKYTCSKKCDSLYKSQTSKIVSKEQLILDKIELKSYEAIGKKYSTSGTTIKKWFKKYDLI